MDGEVDESLREFMNDSVWEFFFRDATANPETTDELFRELPVEDTASASGGRVFGSAECSASEFRTTNHEELERLVDV